MKHLLITSIVAVVLVGCRTTPVATIHTSTQTGNVESVKQFLANGTDVNVKDEDGDTPLDWANKRNQTAATALLRKHGGKTSEELNAKGK